jgi:4a-hydroxytetrahydrobiopterin dehydratase
MLLLKEQKCEPCRGNEEPLKGEQIEMYKEKLKNNWEVIDSKKIKYSFPFENFKRSMAFAQEIARIAEEQDHHPDLCIHYKSVDVELSTHAIGGLSENDFIMAAKIDEL